MHIVEESACRAVDFSAKESVRCASERIHLSELFGKVENVIYVCFTLFSAHFASDGMVYVFGCANSRTTRVLWNTCFLRAHLYVRGKHYFVPTELFATHTMRVFRLVCVYCAIPSGKKCTLQ